MSHEMENPAGQGGVPDETASGAVSDVDGNGLRSGYATASDERVADMTDAEIPDWERRNAETRSAIAKGFSAEPDLDPAGRPYAAPIPDLAAEVTARFLAPDRIPELRRIAATDPKTVVRGLLGRINDRIAYQNARLKKNDSDPEKLTGTPSRPLTGLGLPELAALLLYLHDVAVLRDPRGTSASEVVAMYDPASGLYDMNEEHLRAVARRYRPGLLVRDFTEVLAILKDTAPRRDRAVDPDLIAVANGIFDYRTGELTPFSREHVFTSKTATPWNPDAENVVIHNDEDGTDWDVESWVRDFYSSIEPLTKEEVVNEEMSELLWEVIGAAVRPHVSWNKSAWLFSEVGNNGKGTLLSLIRNLLGPGNWISLSLATAGSRFGLSELLDANMPQAVLTDENAVGSFVDDAAGLKSMITGDAFGIERKGKGIVTTRWPGFMVQCLNGHPRVRDRSPSFLRRLCIIKFIKSFTGAERMYIKEDYLKRPEVLEYVLKRVLTMDYYELSEPEMVKAALAEFREDNDPVAEFWTEFAPQFAWDLVPQAFAYDLYKAWMARYNGLGKPVAYKVFVREVRALIAADPMSLWEDSGPTRPSSMMSAPEYLIAEYNLPEWGNPTVPTSDRSYRDRRSTIPGDTLKQVYRGFKRREISLPAVDLDRPAALGASDTDVAAPVAKPKPKRSARPPAPAVWPPAGADELLNSPYDLVGQGGGDAK